MAKVTKERIENDKMPIFRARFRKLVEEEGGITAFAALTGFSRQSIGYWYNGPRVPDAASLLQLSEKCHCSVDWILGRVDDDNRSDDQKISDMAEYTDLSSDAIKAFHDLPRLGSIISDLFKTRNGQILIEFIGRYLFPSTYILDGDDVEIEIPGIKKDKPLIVNIESLDKTPIRIRTPQGNFRFGIAEAEETLLKMVDRWLINMKTIQRLQGLNEWDQSLDDMDMDE